MKLADREPFPVKVYFFKSISFKIPIFWIFGIKLMGIVGEKILERRKIFGG